VSMMRCDHCESVVDTDEDLESLYVLGYACMCEACRELMESEREEEV
jgi:hypothetical protein